MSRSIIIIKRVVVVVVVRRVCVVDKSVARRSRSRVCVRAKKKENVVPGDRCFLPVVYVAV